VEKRRQIFSATIVLTILGLFAFLVLRPREPLCEGKPLSQWLLNAFDGVRQAPNNWTTLPESDPIRALGPAAIPTLLDMLSTRDTDWNSFISQISRQKEMTFLHLPRLEGKREVAAWAFKALGPQAAPAVPSLIKLLKSPDAAVRGAAATSLSNIGPAAAPAVQALASAWQSSVVVTNPTAWRRGSGNVFLVRSAAALALAEIGPAAAPAVPLLATATNELDAELAILRINQQSLTPFIEALASVTNPAAWTRRAILLSGLGTNAEPAIPFLIAGLNNTNLSVQHQALYALGTLHLQPELCVPALIPLLKSTNNSISAITARSIGAFGNCATSAVPQLRECLTSKEDWLKKSAEAALAEIETKPKAAKKK
jgi:HEAT repeat protein